MDAESGDDDEDSLNEETKVYIEQRKKNAELSKLLELKQSVWDEARSIKIVWS